MFSLQNQNQVSESLNSNLSNRFTIFFFFFISVYFFRCCFTFRKLLRIFPREPVVKIGEIQPLAKSSIRPMDSFAHLKASMRSFTLFYGIQSRNYHHLHLSNVEICPLSHIINYNYLLIINNK